MNFGVKAAGMIADALDSFAAFARTTSKEMKVKADSNSNPGPKADLLV